MHHLNTEPPMLPRTWQQYQRLMDKLVEKDRDCAFSQRDE
jgi:hypothetical protein